MRASGFIDLHCDTLTDTDLYKEGIMEDSMNDSRKALSFSKIEKGTNWGQFFAIFIPIFLLCTGF